MVMNQENYKNEAPTVNGQGITVRKDRLASYGIYIILLIVFSLSALIIPNFIKIENLLNLLRYASVLGIVAIGQTFVMIAGEFDLSVGALMSTIAVFTAGIMDKSNENLWQALLVGFGIAVAIALINGIFVTKAKIPSFIITLAVMIGLEGVRLLHTKGVPRGGASPFIRELGHGTLWGIPIPVLVFLGAIIIGIFVLERTTLGRKIYATGGNPITARFSGINPDTIIMISFLICSLVSAVAAFLLFGYVGMVDNQLGRGYELDSIAAVVVGGTVIGGGKGRISGTVAGVLIMIILFNVMSLMNMNIESRLIIKGLVLLIAVAIYSRGRSL
jgi:ribose/xylose/arabinose/galactoside ABC-type transport system permease subunit